MTDESQSTVDKWRDEHRANLARKGIELQEEEETTTFHCRRCHRDLPIAQYKPHYKTCPGFSGKCEEWNCAKWNGHDRDRHRDAGVVVVAGSAAVEDDQKAVDDVVDLIDVGADEDANDVDVGGQKVDVGKAKTS